ncbi:hypothetical protein D3C75_1189340 [compost metagenome]
MHMAQLFQPGNHLVHKRLHLLRGDGDPAFSGFGQYLFQLGETLALLDRQLQQLAFRQDQPILLQHCNLR